MYHSPEHTDLLQQIKHGRTEWCTLASPAMTRRKKCKAIKKIEENILVSL